MITADDPRHGTYAGYRAHCDCTPCSDAAYLYMTRLHAEHDRGIYRTVEARGVQRRIRALQALGWSMDVIAEKAGLSSAQAVYRIAAVQDVVHASTRDAIARVYDELCMTPATDRLANRKRALARKNGYAPPLAWDDIDLDDAPAEAPQIAHTRDDYVDEAAVKRALDGDRTVRLTHAERFAVVRRAMAIGVPLREVEARTGLNPHRYTPTATEAAA